MFGTVALSLRRRFQSNNHAVPVTLHRRPPPPPPPPTGACGKPSQGSLSPSGQRGRTLTENVFDFNSEHFDELALDGSNYLEWAIEAKIHLGTKGLHTALISNSDCTEAQKREALAFLWRHLNEGFRIDYRAERDPFVLWQSLKDRFEEEQKARVLSQAQNDWLNLRFHDYKLVSQYDSALHLILSRFALCDREITEEELIEKTLSTFHPINLQLNRQYRAARYKKYYDLLWTLREAETHNLLLMKGQYNDRPTGASTSTTNWLQARGQEQGGNRRRRGKYNGRK